MVALYVTIIFSFFSPIGLGYVDAFSSIMIGTIFLAVIPMSSIYFFSKKDPEVYKKEERTKLYLISLVSYLTCSAIFWILNSHVMFVISMAYVFVSSAVSIINIFWKISAHSAGVAGPTTALIYVFGTNLIPLYVLTLFVFWIRLKIKAHNILQLIIGSIVAIFITLMVYTILW